LDPDGLMHMVCPAEHPGLVMLVPLSPQVQSFTTAPLSRKTPAGGEVLDGPLQMAVSQRAVIAGQRLAELTNTQPKRVVVFIEEQHRNCCSSAWAARLVSVNIKAHTATINPAFGDNLTIANDPHDQL
jgi:hypothetical protein